MLKSPTPLERESLPSKARFWGGLQGGLRGGYPRILPGLLGCKDTSTS